MVFGDAAQPRSFYGGLRQILSQGRKRIGLLVGAGAPLAIKDTSGAPLIPGVDKLTEQVIEGLDGEQAVAAKAIVLAWGRPPTSRLSFHAFDF